MASNNIPTKRKKNWRPMWASLCLATLLVWTPPAKARTELSGPQILFATIPGLVVFSSILVASFLTKPQTKIITPDTASSLTNAQGFPNISPHPWPLYSHYPRPLWLDDIENRERLLLKIRPKSPSRWYLVWSKDSPARSWATDL